MADKYPEAIPGLIPMFGTMRVSTRNADRIVNDPSKFEGYQKALPDGRVQLYDTSGNPTRIFTPPSGGDAFGGFFSGLGTAASNVASGVSDGISSAGSMVANSPEAMAIITAIAAANGVDPATTAAILGSNRAGQDGNLLAGLETAALSYGMGNAMSPTSGATTSPVSGGTTGGWTSLGEAASGGAIPSGPFAGATAAELQAANGVIQTGPFAGATAAQLQAANTGGGLLSQGATGAAGAVGAATGGSNVAGSLIPGISNNLLTTGLNTIGGLLQGQSASNAAQTQSDAIVRAAQIAADAAKFKPVGVTTGFGSSKFGYDASGNLTSAGYELTPEMKAQRDALIGTSTGLLDQFKGSQAATAGMGTAAQRAMTLGNQYLATDPQAQAQKYLSDQMGLLAPERAQQMAALQAQMQAQGRGGFAIGGGTGGQGAANPQLQALFNAQMQQNNQLAADATRGGMDYAKFGAGMVGTGGDLLSSMYGTQTAAFNPYKTALGGAQTVEGLGQNALTTGMDLGKTASAASADAGRLLSGGMTQAAGVMAPANAYSPWANLLAGGAQALQQYKFGQ